jgi:hypothetical protein
VFLLPAALILAPASPCRAGRGAAPQLDALSPPANVEEARARLQLLVEEAGKVDAWVDGHWEEEFANAYPGLSLAPRREGESAQAYGERSMRARMASSGLKAKIREDRKAWIERECRTLLETVIREEFPVRLGTYDPDREIGRAHV